MSRRKTTLDSLDFLLNLAEHTREAGVSWSGGYSLDRKVLEFAQIHKIVTYREAREIIRKRTLARKEGNILTNETKKFLELPLFHTWITSRLHDPIVFPAEYQKGKEIYFLEEMKELLQNNNDIKEKYETFNIALNDAEQATAKVNEWIGSLYHEGKLENWIIAHKNALKHKQKITCIGKELLGNLIVPEKTEVILEKGETPALTVGEREAFQFLLWKAHNLNEEELVIKNEFILEGKGEDYKKNGLIVIFEQQEALKKGYGENISFAGFHYAKLEESMKSLLEKKRKLLISKKKGNLELTISLIDKLEMTFTPAGKTEGKKYIMARIPYDIINHHGKYTAFPANHFAILRITPPKSKVDKTETCFFDILCNEKPYQKDQNRNVRRLKDSFLLMIGGKEMIENRNQERLANKIKNIYAPKAINLGLLKSFKEDVNRESKIVYNIEYERHEVIKRYLEGKGK